MPRSAASDLGLHSLLISQKFIATLLDAAKPRPSGALMVTRVNNII